MSAKRRRSSARDDNKTRKSSSKDMIEEEKSTTIGHQTSNREVSTVEAQSQQGDKTTHLKMLVRPVNKRVSSLIETKAMLERENSEDDAQISQLPGLPLLEKYSSSKSEGRQPLQSPRFEESLALDTAGGARGREFDDSKQIDAFGDAVARYVVTAGVDPQMLAAPGSLLDENYADFESRRGDDNDLEMPIKDVILKSFPTLMDESMHPGVLYESANDDVGFTPTCKQRRLRKEPMTTNDCNQFGESSGGGFGARSPSNTMMQEEF